MTVERIADIGQQHRTQAEGFDPVLDGLGIDEFDDLVALLLAHQTTTAPDSR